MSAAFLSNPAYDFDEARCSDNCAETNPSHSETTHLSRLVACHADRLHESTHAEAPEL